MRLQCISVATLLATTLAAQQQRGLLYTPKYHVTSPQCVAAWALNQVPSNEIEYVVPDRNNAYKSEQFTPLQAYTTMVGDHDDNGEYWAPNLFGDKARLGQEVPGIDAIMRPRNENGVIRPNPRNLFISASSTTQHCLGAGFGWPVTGGDVFRVLDAGYVERFLSEIQVRQAFDLSANEPVNVDAICFYWHQDPTRGGIYLSVEDLEMPLGGGIIQDGDLLRIPQTAITWATSAYDGALLVMNVVANSGQIVRREWQVDLMVANANVSDFAGMAVPQILDLDGLTFEPAGGFFNGGHPHLWFCGEALTGCSVLTTLGGGTIAVTGGVELGEHPAIPTIGNHLMLLPTIDPLDGLAITGPRLCHLAVDTLTPVCGAGGCVVDFEIGGGAAGAMVYLLIDVAFDACQPDAVLGAYANCGFPELYPFVLPIASMLGADGCTIIPVALPGGFAGLHVRAQAVLITAAGNIVLSPGATVDLN